VPGTTDPTQALSGVLLGGPSGTARLFVRGEPDLLIGSILEGEQPDTADMLSEARSNRGRQASTRSRTRISNTLVAASNRRGAVMAGIAVRVKDLRSAPATGRRRRSRRRGEAELTARRCAGRASTSCRSRSRRVIDTDSWQQVQSPFVEEPGLAVTEADRLKVQLRTSGDKHGYLRSAHVREIGSSNRIVRESARGGGRK